MNSTIEYYNQNAEDFYQSTVNVDMSELHDRLLKHLPKGSLILDAGCGSGRDSLAFLKRGFQVEAFDASLEMVERAAMLTGLDVKCSTFSEWTVENRYEGIWACASLLHLPDADLEGTLSKLFKALKSSGVIYLSFKEGNTERVKEGRHFTDSNEDSLNQLLEKFPGTNLLDLWLSTDARKNRNEVWLNAIVRKK